MAPTNPFLDLPTCITDVALEWVRETKSPFDGGIGLRILMDFAVAAAARLSLLDRLSLTNFDVTHLNHAVAAAPAIMSRLTSLVVGFSSPDARANWEALKKVITLAEERLIRFENSPTEGNRFQNFTPYRFDRLQLASLTLHNSVFPLLPAFPNVVALYLPMLKNGDQLFRILDQHRQPAKKMTGDRSSRKSGRGESRLRVLSAPDLAFNDRSALQHLADICGSTLEELNLSRASGLRADENIPVFMTRFKALKRANVTFDVHGKSVVEGESGEGSGSADGGAGEPGADIEDYDDALHAVSSLAAGISALTTFSVLWWEQMSQNFLPTELEEELDEAFPALEELQMRFKPPVLTKGCALFTKLDESTKVLRARKNCLRAPVRATISMETNY